MKKSDVFIGVHQKQNSLLAFYLSHLSSLSPCSLSISHTYPLLHISPYSLFFVLPFISLFCTHSFSCLCLQLYFSTSFSLCLSFSLSLSLSISFCLIFCSDAGQIVFQPVTQALVMSCAADVCMSSVTEPKGLNLHLMAPNGTILNTHPPPPQIV